MVITVIVGMIFRLIEVPHQVVGCGPKFAPTFGQRYSSSFGDQFILIQFNMLGIILTFLFVDFFDKAGTLVAVANQAGLMKDNKLPRAGRALFLIQLHHL